VRGAESCLYVEITCNTVLGHPQANKKLLYFGAPNK